MAIRYLTFGSVSLVDLTDIYTSTDAPTNPYDNMYWIYTGAVPNVLRRYSSSKPGWINVTAQSLNELDPTSAAVLSALNTAMNDPTTGVQTKLTQYNSDITTLKNQILLKSDKTETTSLRTSNMLYNSEFKIGTNRNEGWTLGTGWSIDTSNKINDSNTALANVTGAISDNKFPITSIFYSVTPNQKYTISIFAYTDNYTSITNDAFMEIEFYEDAVLKGSDTVSIKPTQNFVWLRFSKTVTTTATCNFVKVKAYVVRNGKLWIGRPMLQYSDTLAAWVPSIYDLYTYPTEQRLQSAEVSISPSSILQTVTSSNAYNSDLGKNKWIVKRYSITKPAGTIPEFDMLTNSLPVQTVETVDSDKFQGLTIFGADYDNYIGVATTYINASSAFSVSTTPTHDDGGSIYINNVAVYGYGTTGNTTATTLSFNKGWNRIDVMWCEQTGSDSFNLNTKLTNNANVSVMSCYNNIENMSEGRIKILADEVGLRVQQGNIIASINAEVANGQSSVQIAADAINLQGYATFTDLKTPGSTSIHGGNLITESVEAKHIKAHSITVNEVASDFGQNLNFSSNNSINLMIQPVSNKVDAQGKTITGVDSNFKFSDTGMDITRSDSNLSINISNSQISFLQKINSSTVKLATISDQKMNIKKADIDEWLIVGSHVVQMLDSNHDITIVRWVGEGATL